METWKDIKGYEGLYQVSDLGRIKRFVKDKKGRVLKPSAGKGGYINVNLSKNGVSITKTIHTLVAITFLNHIPNGYKGLVVDHVNNIKSDNRLSNLQLITQRQNTSKDKKGFTSKYTGVSWHKKSEKWISRIVINGKVKYIGCFHNELDAHKAYQKALSSLTE